ncbi:putative ankyrin repeat protein [Tupanvirus deep ocean]|uniref:Ankyrin repeat protein n=2 Tax=Tupanvirus TaxID=2094720 RepID=A0AC62A8V0_9VIRU|nr:putative ankyrin repeat protein [Tupanvirus deep ocean]QKU34207.1 putative ankyrin repeat protein [Tupanvirus deep ocean]
MSKYQPRIFINNPEKNVPDSILEQFFLAIKEADLDKIRDFAITYKNKYNLIEKSSKGSSDSGKTPFHLVLELDEKIADNDKKLRIMKYLDQMGAPMDLPDSANVWPIHLAASLQSEEIVDFLVSRKVGLNRKDSSNNTPVHYAINGKEISCPRSTSIKDLIPPQKTEKLPLNKSLENINNILIKLLNENNNLNDNLIHMLNTIAKIPEMYEDDTLSRNLQTEMVNIFSDIAMLQTFPADVPATAIVAPGFVPPPTTTGIIPKSGGMTAQQIKIEQLIDRTYSNINNELLRGLTNAMDIAPNNGGWGPYTPTGDPTIATNRKAPNNLQRIMKNTRIESRREIETEYANLRNTVTTISAAVTDKIVRTNIPSIITGIDGDYINPLIFCPTCETIDNGERATLTKMLFLLSYAHYKENYVNTFVTNVMNNYMLISPLHRSQILTNPYNPGWNGWATNVSGYLFMSSIPFLVTDVSFDGVRTNFDMALANVAQQYDGAVNIAQQCINNELRVLFCESDETPVTDVVPIRNPHNERDGVLGRIQFNDLFTNPNYERFAAMLPRLSAGYRNGNRTWFDMLSQFINDINPRPILGAGAAAARNFAANNIFSGPYIAGTFLPQTPFANELPLGMHRHGGFDTYTYYELFRVMNAIEKFLINGDFQINDYPDIFGMIGGAAPRIPINQWDTYIDTVANSNVVGSAVTIGIQFPEFIFLYRVLAVRVQNHIASIIRNCVRGLIDRANTDVVPTNDVQILRNLVMPIDDAHMYNLLLPSDPNPNDFLGLAGTDPFVDLKARKWTRAIKDGLMDWFSKFRNNIPDDLWNSIIGTTVVQVPIAIGPFLQPINYFEHGNLNLLRQLIEEAVPPQRNTINRIINNRDYRAAIRTYFGSEGVRGAAKVATQTESHAVIPRYNIITRNIRLIDEYDRNLRKLTTRTITDVFFLTETHGYIFVRAKQMLLELQREIIIINTIIADIIAYINNRTYYYVAQIFLPAFIKQVISAISYLINIRDLLTEFNRRKTDFYPLVDMTDRDVVNIITLGDNFIKYINEQQTNVYKNLLDVVKYHNNVVDFLNYTSALQLINSRTNVIPRPPPYAGKNEYRSTTTNLFTMNLIPLESLPDDIVTDIPNFEALQAVLRLYRIPKMAYYGDANVASRLRFEIFSPRGNPAVGGSYTFETYRDVISYRRHRISDDPNIISQSPPGPGPVGGFNNMQLNITAINNDPIANPAYTIHNIPNGISGEWLNLRLVDPLGPRYNPRRIRYSEAFIGYQTGDYTFEWLNGMPPSIRRLVGKHLKMMKQRVIEETIQFIVNNKYVDPAVQNSELLKLYEDIRRLGNESTYTNMDDVKIYVVIGKLLDSIINKLLEYSVRQSVSAWILGIATRDNRYRGITDILTNTVDIIRQKDFIKMSLNNIDKDAINELLKLDPSFVDYKLTQIEPNPANLKYTTGATPRNLIHYLYNINYFSATGNINSNKRCYKINKNIVSKLVTSNTINAKNSDGNTPLHMAISINHPILVDLLISKGANPKGFTNIHGKTPWDLGMTAIDEHTSFTDGLKLIDTINNFVIPFNDLLMSRLKDEKFGNNIIKSINMGIPIQLVMYNHMFHLYLENYRYGFSIELKNAIRKLFKKYFNQNENIFPIDLFEIKSQQELSNIISPEIPANKVRTVINEGTQKKVDNYRSEINDIKIQLDGMTKELLVTTDPIETKMINDIRENLQNQIDRLNAKITSLRVEQPNPVDDMAIYLSAYQASASSISRRIDRTYGLVEFYNFAFGRIGSTKQMYLGIWDNYLNKNLLETPSMIFSLLNKLIIKLIGLSRNNAIDAEIKGELATIVEFYALVRDYIETKNPNGNLDDDPLLREEFDQMVYLINLIITPAIRNILLNQIYQGLREMDGADTIVRDQSVILNEIVNVQFNGQTLDTYLENILPTLALKTFTNVYRSSDDSDRRITTSADLFSPIIQIVKSNRIIQLTDDSLLVQNLREYLIPFMSNTYQYFIHHLRLSVYGYERYLLNTYQLTKIMQSLI